MRGDVRLDECMGFVALISMGEIHFVHSADMVRCLIHRMGTKC